MSNSLSHKKKSFYRKLAYGVGIAVLLYPLALLSSPATVVNPGGTLSQMRAENGLSQANLGEIDPASETMKLATLGLRGLAVNLLWSKANDYKKREDWTNLTATLEQLALLQPNFITFWKYQSWNVAYNVSVQFDDYRDRYYYVREGIEFLEQGVAKNRENRQIPQLLWDLGWFVGQKIGKADEAIQYRRLFRNDDEYHGDEPPPGSDERDNWLVSKVEYENAVSAIRDRGKSLGKKSEKIVYSSPAKSQMSYGEAIENEGEFSKGQNAWVVASDDWRDFGDLWIEHSTGRRLQLGHADQLSESIDERVDQLDNLIPGLREQLIEKKREALTPEELAALDKPKEERGDQEHQLAYKANQAVEVLDIELVEAIAKQKPELRKEASLLAAWLANKRVDLIFTERYKSDSNFDYWKLRAEFEQTDTAVEARRNIFEGNQAFTEDQDAEKAMQLYEKGFAKWREVLDTYPALLDTDGTTGDDLLVYIVDYRKVLRSVDEEIPDDFALWDIIENFDLEQQFEEEIANHRLKEEEERSEADDDEVQSDAADSESPAGEVDSEPSDDDQAESEESDPEASDTPGSDTPGSDTPAAVNDARATSRIRGMLASS